MSLTRTYLDRCRDIADTVARQEKEIIRASEWFSETIRKGRMVHVFGSGHSRIMVEEMWPRYGSFPGFNPIVELSLTFHNLVVGANGQRQAMFLENVSGLAERILRNFRITPDDCALVISSGGTNVVPVEIAELFRKARVHVVSIVTLQHCQKSPSRRSDGKKLPDFSDITLDTGAPAGDSMIRVPGLDTPVSPGSTVGGAMIVNCIKAEVARLLTEKGSPPPVLTSQFHVGAERSASLFEAAYDEHARRLAGLYEGIGNKP
jgi:uncharacterized phosphosugar-binding protein